MKLLKNAGFFFISLLFSNVLFAQQFNPDIVVDINGTGDFTSIQAAFDAAPANTPTVIYVKRGLYDKEKLIIPANKTNITLIGESREETIISYDIYNCNDGGDGLCPDNKVALWASNTNLVRTAATLTIMANDFRAENITIRNTAGPVGQAQAITLQADRNVFVNCNILAYQDTIYFWTAETSRAYFKSCMILGRTDYIYGRGVGVFDECEIRSYGGAWITAPSTEATQTYGFVFYKCNLTYQPNSPRNGDDGVKIKFGRPWHEYPKVAWLYCTMPAEIDPLGWGDKWNMAYADTDTRLHLYEWMNTGPGADMSGRANWAGLRAMTDQNEANLYEPKIVLAGSDNWDPTAIAPTVTVFNWDGGAATTGWMEANNWNPNGVPAASEVANVDGSLTINANGGNFAADLNLVNGATIDVSTNSSVTLLTLNQATISSSASASLSGNIKTKGVVNINVSGNLNIAATLNGVHQITKTGAGICQLNSNNSGYSGNLVIEAGDLQAKVGNSLGNPLKVTVKTNGKLSIDVSNAIQTKTVLYTEGLASIVLNKDITINEWYIDGVLQPVGTYDATTNATTISGTGKIIIGRPSEFTFLGGLWDDVTKYSPALLPKAGEKVYVNSGITIESALSQFEGDMYVKSGGSIRLRQTKDSKCLGPVRMSQGAIITYATSGTGFYLNAPIVLEGDISLNLNSNNVAGSVMDLAGTFSGAYKVIVRNIRDFANTATVKLGGNNTSFTGVWDLTLAAANAGGSSAIDGVVENAFGSGIINVEQNNYVIFSHERAAGSELKLNLAGNGRAVLNTTVKVQKMTINGVTFSNGTYDKTTNPEFFTGSGRIEINESCPDVSASPIVAAANASQIVAGGTLQLSHPIAGGTWTSSSTATATIDANGLITGLAEGTTTITYTLCTNSITKQIGVVAVELDSDNDGVKNSLDSCPNTPAGEAVNVTGCSQSQLDDDGDGVMNTKDVCPNTTSGAAVDANGCFTLASDNFSIEVVGESCKDKKNGKIIISAKKALNYSTVINGVTYNFTTTKTIENVTPGVYDFCIAVASDSYNQCFNVVVESGSNITAKTAMVSDKLSVDIEKGTAPYTVLLNGKNVLETTAASFSIDVNPGDLVQVQTAVACEGTINSKIDNALLVAYPNPTSAAFDIDIPAGADNVKVDLLDIKSQLISSDSYKVTNGKIQMNLESNPVGVYFVRVYLSEEIEVLRIIKKQ